MHNRSTKDHFVLFERATMRNGSTNGSTNGKFGCSRCRERVTNSMKRTSGSRFWTWNVHYDEKSAVSLMLTVCFIFDSVNSSPR